jgi:ribonuclease HI
VTTPDLESLNPDLGVALYTDGSSKAVDRSGGWAWLARDFFGSVAWSSGFVADTTNNRMEMMAWIQGLNSLHEVHGPCAVLVCSDSQYVGLGYQDPGRVRKANADLWDELETAGAQHEYVQFCHVKGHGKGPKKDRFNEQVDELAGLARRGGQRGL